jgi:acyl-coenzyme A thioesterase PaaI-like protein
MSEPGGPQLPGFAARIGIELLSATAEEVVAELQPDDRHLAPAGDVHHGVYARARPEHVGEREQLWSTEVRRAGDDALVASGQVRLWHVADHPEGWRSR